jgi:enoyl-CoA hydratase/carnithine racemase
VLARIDEEVKVFAERLTSPEAREAFSAFLEKRAPDFAKSRG